MSVRSDPFTVDPLTRADQRRAADPRASAWVSANAGAGKTKVLTDRVLRLLLDGTPPARILCLTFTKAAAANMSNRVFNRLGQWVTLDDAALGAELDGLTGETTDRSTLRLARRLFARAVETPGGLKIETLHALCERLLHMFPFEANVPAQFEVLDERKSSQAFEAATGSVLADAFAGADPDLRAALEAVGPETARETLRQAIRAAMARRDLFSDPHGLPKGLARLGRALALRDDDTPDSIERAIVDRVRDELTALAARLRTGMKSDDRLADKLLAAAGAPTRSGAVEVYRSVFFTSEDKPCAETTLGTKKVPADVKEHLLAEQRRLVPLFDALRSARAFDRTRALFTLAAEIHRRIEAQKARVGALDFDDLIQKTLDLFRRVDASWVLYKLDRGVDHVLVDEAQDTNPDQWGILRALTAEFVAGKGAREANRTRFAVGDPKQSIYSFQGAEPREFEATRKSWLREANEVALGFEDVKLNLSFRSTHGVLRAVDAVFAISEHFQGLAFDDDQERPVHASARADAPGAVELWPIVEPEPQPEPDAWTEPVDALNAHAPPIVVARRVAHAIRTWTTSGDATGRLRRPGDILILVRKRSAAFEEVIRSLKGLGVPVAGQDRLEVAAHIAVTDLVAVGRAGLLPADDLTLATALKTPLVGLTDDDLVRIAASRPRDETLEDALGRVAAAGDPAAVRGLAALRRWIALAGNEGPFGFYATLLSPMGGRASLVARLGSEAGDAIDVFLGEAAKAETGIDAPCLDGFLAPFIERSDRGATPLTVKRDMEAGRDEVRVMTVHGAKGLEAPVVVVIDGCEPVGGRDAPLLPVSDDPGGGAAAPVWSGRKPAGAEAIAAARANLKARAQEEHNRLLYVAMTRAADHLVIAPYRGATQATPASWCEMVRLGLERAFGPGETIETKEGPLRLWQHGDAALPAMSTDIDRTRTDQTSAPAWLTAPVAIETEAAPPVNPSGALAAADGQRSVQSRLSNAEARQRGTLIHALLEHLPRTPPADRAATARHFLTARAPAMTSPQREAIVAAVLRLFEEPDLAPLFTAETRAEVSLSGRVAIDGTERAVFGRVDRLAVQDETVHVCDFKTGRPPADDAPLPTAESAQIALYAALLARIYPGRRVVATLVWTAGPVVRRLTDAEIDAALATIGREISCSSSASA